jgi:FMN phosphatase YigB (HAD superfamily)
MSDTRQPLTIGQNIRTVIFDLDGTIYDKRGLARRMVRRLWWCLPLLASERLARRNMHYVQYASEGEFFHAFFRAMSRGHWWTVTMAAVWYHTVYMPAMLRLIARHHHPRPETMALIEECERRGIRMAIYSDYGCVVEKLEALGIDPKRFDLLVSAPELGALKPSEPCARRVMEMLQADPKTTLFVGDRDEKDGASARFVGAEFLLV